MFPKDYTFYQFMIDIAIPLATLIAGIIIERKWHITMRFKSTDKSKTKQSQEINDSPNSSALQLRDNYGQISLDTGDNNPPVQLPDKERQFVEKIEKILGDQGSESTFTDRYSESYGNLQNNQSFAAPLYLSAFLQVKDTFLNTEIYHDDINKDLVKTLKAGLENLQKFSDESSDDINSLKEIISGIENTIWSLMGYVK